MMPAMENQVRQRITTGFFPRGLLILAVLIVSALWMALTPDGLLGKADALGYAVCHRFPDHSFFIGSRQMPLCARCSGMYLGMLTSLMYLLRSGARTEFPPLKITLPLSLFFLTFGVDGVNSLLWDFPTGGGLYPPTNFLRLATGAGLGMLVPMFLLPVFHQTLWLSPLEQPVLENWRQVIPLMVLAALIALGVYSEIEVILLPLAVLSALTVPVILSICYAVLWVIILHKENQYASIKQAWTPLLAGFLTAMLQIGLIDLLRYQLTGTWAGF